MNIFPSSAEGWNTLFQVVSILLIAGTVLAGAGAIITGGIVSKRQARALADANAEAAKANEGVADAALEIAKAKQETARLTDEAESAKAEQIRIEKEAAQKIERAKVELLREHNRLAKKQERTAEAQQTTAEALKEATQTLLSTQWSLQQVRSFLNPRRLIGEDREKFRAGLKDLPVAAVEIIWQGDAFIGEPRRFAEDIAEALHGAKGKDGEWRVNRIQGVGIGNTDPNPFRVKAIGGVRIIVRDVEAAPLTAQALQWAFLEGGFVADLFPNPEIKNDGVIRLLVLVTPVNGGRVLHFAPETPKP